MEQPILFGGCSSLLMNLYFKWGSHLCLKQKHFPQSLQPRLSSLKSIPLQMILQQLFLPALFTFVLLLILVNYWKKCKASAHKFPPGPPKLPFIGNLHQLIGPLPHQTLVSLAKKYGSVMHLQLGEQSVLLISSSEAAKEVLKTNELCFAQRPHILGAEIFSFNASGLIFAPYGDYWRQVRKVCVIDLLSTKCVQSFRTIREQEVWGLIESIASDEGEVANLTPMLFSVASNITSRAAFGFRCKDEVEVMSLFDELFSVSGIFILADLYPSLRFLPYITGVKSRLARGQKKLAKILDDIIEKHSVRRKSKSSDDGSDPENILDVLVKIQESNISDLLLTNNHIKAVTMDMFGAGIETVPTTMEWALAELIKSPRVMEKAQTEIRQALKGKTRIEEADIKNLNYLKLIIKETLRLHPPSALMPRETRERCEISGYEIPVKTKVILNIWAIGRDPNSWSEPECFKPERFDGSPVDFKGSDFEFIPFGAGRRMCPGLSFATANLELVLAQI